MTELTTKEAAEYKGVKIGTVFGWVSEGKLTRPITKAQLDAMSSKRRGVKLNPKNKELVQQSDLSCLTEHQREIIQWHYLEGRTLKDIATELKVSRAAVKSAEDRALGKLLREKINP